MLRATLPSDKLFAISTYIIVTFNKLLKAFRLYVFPVPLAPYNKSLFAGSSP